MSNDNPTEKLKLKIEALGLSPAAQNDLFLEINLVEKQIVKLDFKSLRSAKDKEIAVNLLNTSLENLEKNNRELLLKNEEIEQKNLELSAQKTQIEASAQKLEANLRELTHSYEALEQFSYIASHDLKTPLRNIAGYSQLLKRRYENQLDGQALEFLNFIVDGVKQMHEIISDVQEYSQMSIRNLQPVLSDLNSLVEKSLKNLAEEIEESGAVVKITPLPTLSVHPSGIIQLFQNLVSNAIKFKTDQPPIVEIFAEKKQKHWHFQVSDNGCGIEKTFNQKIFQPFQRLQTTLPGKGMGLAICKKVVQLHHGEIWHEPRTEGGSVFHFTIAE